MAFTLQHVFIDCMSPGHSYYKTLTYSCYLFSVSLQKCPNHTRDKFQNSEKKFLKTVPVLQWKKHAEESEYERLRKFSGAQGWMGVTWRSK